MPPSPFRPWKTLLTASSPNSVTKSVQRRPANQETRDASPPMTVRLIVERFEDIWQQETPPDIGAFLEEGNSSSWDNDERRTLLICLMKVDLEYRWRRWRSSDGDATELCLEAYARRFPQLGADDSWPEELILAEYKNRWRWGDRPEVQHVLNRFPARAAGLLPETRTNSS